MDVNETLARMRAVVSELGIAKSVEDSAYLGDQLAESFQALDEWLSKGGFLPEDWSAKRAPAAFTETEEWVAKTAPSFAEDMRRARVEG